MDETVSLEYGRTLRWKSKCGRYTVIVSPKCFARLLAIAREYYPMEAGTTLVGCYSNDGFDAKVLDLGPLSPDSSGSQMCFQRGIEGLREFFAALLRALSGTTHYVGEWHSHPDGSPTPSRSDDESAAAIASDTQTRCPVCLLLLLGGNPFRAPDLGVFVYSRGQRRIDLVPDI